MKNLFTVDSRTVVHCAAMAVPFIDRDPSRASAAHLLRRTSMTVDADRVNDLASRSWDEAVNSILGDPGPSETVPRSEEWGETTLWWVRQMSRPSSGLRDRMTWFWHNLLTTNAWSVNDDVLIGDQLQGLQDNSLGNFRTMLHGFVTSGALLEYLDASYSEASNPNENLARELMELFTIGRGNYSQDDVRSAARALAGWVVDDGRVEFRRENAFVAPLVLLGDQDDWNTEKVVDRLCDHPATAARVSARLWRHLVGTDLDESAAADLGTFWQGQELEIMPLVERILTEPNFQQSRLNKPRTGLEWFCAASSAVGYEFESVWQLQNLGQAPYLPPNVAGWPEGNRWLTPGSLLSRSSVIHDMGIGEEMVGTSSSVEEILDRCGLQAVSDATVAAISAIRPTEQLPTEGAHFARWRLALTCPEFHLS